MMNAFSPPMTAILLLLSFTLVLVLIRLLRGPSLPDRVVALDLLTTVTIAMAAVYAAATDQQSLIDVATVLAIVSFLGTIAFAYYIGFRR